MFGSQILRQTLKPWKVVKKIYRELSRTKHPDKLCAVWIQVSSLSGSNAKTLPESWNFILPWSLIRSMTVENVPKNSEKNMMTHGHLLLKLMRLLLMRRRGVIGSKLVIQMVDFKPRGALLCPPGSWPKKIIYMFWVFMVSYLVSCYQRQWDRGGIGPSNILGILFLSKLQNIQ